MENNLQETGEEETRRIFSDKLIKIMTNPEAEAAGEIPKQSAVLVQKTAHSILKKVG